jgi:hypothetical protein
VRRISKRNKVAAEAIVIAGEDPAQFEILCDQLEKEYAPHTRWHLELVNYIAGLLWRLRRIPYFEGAMIEALQTEIAPRRTSSSPAEPSNVIGLALIRTRENDDALGKLSRHEAALMNRVRRSLQLLFASQAV